MVYVIDDENMALLGDEVSVNEKRDSAIITAASNLNDVLRLLGISSAFSITIFVINFNLEKDLLPRWSIFLILFVGHAGILALAVLTIGKLFFGLGIFDDKNMKFLRRLTGKNDKRFPLSTFIISCLGQLLGASFSICMFEILLYLSIEGLIADYFPLLPLYIFALLCLAGAILCKTSSITSGILWALVITFLVLLNLRLAVKDNVVDWFTVMSPLALILLTISCSLVATIVNSCSGIYILKYPQKIALFFHSLGSVSAYVAFVFAFIVLKHKSTSTEVSDGTLDINMRLTSIALLVSTNSFIIGYIICMHVSITQTINRGGVMRPKELSRSETGVWDVDKINNVDTLILFGEVEINSSKGCCMNCSQQYFKC